MEKKIAFCIIIIIIIIFFVNPKYIKYLLFLIGGFGLLACCLYAKKTLKYTGGWDLPQITLYDANCKFDPKLRSVLEEVRDDILNNHLDSELILDIKKRYILTDFSKYANMNICDDFKRFKTYNQNEERLFSIARYLSSRPTLYNTVTGGNDPIYLSDFVLLLVKIFDIKKTNFTMHKMNITLPLFDNSDDIKKFASANLTQYYNSESQFYLDTKYDNMLKQYIKDPEMYKDYHFPPVVVFDKTLIASIAKFYNQDWIQYFDFKFNSYLKAFINYSYMRDNVSYKIIYMTTVTHVMGHATTLCMHFHKINGKISINFYYVDSHMVNRSIYMYLDSLKLYIEKHADNAAFRATAQQKNIDIDIANIKYRSFEHIITKYAILKTYNMSVDEIIKNRKTIDIQPTERSSRGLTAEDYIFQRLEPICATFALYLAILIIEVIDNEDDLYEILRYITLNQSYISEIIPKMLYSLFIAYEFLNIGSSEDKNFPTSQFYIQPRENIKEIKKIGFKPIEY